MTTVSGCVEDQQIIMGTVTANDIEWQFEHSLTHDYCLRPQHFVGVTPTPDDDVVDDDVMTAVAAAALPWCWRLPTDRRTEAAQRGIRWERRQIIYSLHDAVVIDPVRPT